MKNLKLVNLLALTVLFLFLGGCQKDEVDYRNSTKNLYQSDEKYSNSKYISVSEIREISIFFKKNSIKYGSRDNSIFDTSRVYVVEFSQNYKTYSIYLDTKKEGTIHNLVFIEENGKFSKPTIMEYQGTKQFVNDFNQRNVTFEKFEGTIAQYTFNDFFNVGRSTEIDCNCFKEYIFPIITGEPGQNNGYNSGGSSPTSDGYSPPSFNWTTWANWFSGISSGNNGNNNNDGNNSNNDDNNTNNSFSSGCPWGHISFYLFGKLHCFPIHGGGTGNNEDGELETFTTDNTGGRTTEEECLSIVKGMGIVTQESNLIQAYTSTNDPVSTQLNNCMNNSAIQAKINELESNNLLDPCSGKKISIDVKNLALDICFGCEKNGVGLTPESLEDAYYDALDGKIYVDLNELPIHLLDCNKTSEENLGDFNNFMHQNGGCDNVGFRNALSKYLGFGSILDQNIPAISASNKMCPNSIIIKPSKWDPTRQNVAGITGLQISLNDGKGGSVPLTFSNLFFKVDQTGDCGISTAQLISDAINSTILIAEQNLENGIPIFKNGLDYNSQFVRLVETEIKRIATNLGCSPKGDPKMNGTTGGQIFYSSVIPSDYENGIGRDYHCGAQFVKFINMQTGCP